MEKEKAVNDFVEFKNIWTKEKIEYKNISFNDLNNFRFNFAQKRFKKE